MKQHTYQTQTKSVYAKLIVASMLLALVPFTGAKFALAEDAIPDEIQALLPSIDGDSDISERDEFLAEFADDDDSGTALADADVEVVILSDDDDDSSNSSVAGGSSNNAGFAEPSSSSSSDDVFSTEDDFSTEDVFSTEVISSSEVIEAAGLSGESLPQDILDLLDELFGDGDDDDTSNDDFGDGDSSGNTDSGVGTLITDELVWQYDETAFSSEFYDRKGNGPALQTTITQDDFPDISLTEARRQGALVYTTPFRHADGHGDGPGINPDNPTDENVGDTGRPTLQGNGTFLRVNGMDTQTCQECHGVINSSIVPPILGIAGQGGISASPMFRTKNIDVDDSDGLSLDKLGIAAFDGRLINPPKNLGMGGVELGGQEITRRLQRTGLLASKLAERANRRVKLPLFAKGVDFGSIIAKPDGSFDTSLVEGVDADLQIRPFGRKGEFPTVRAFDVGAMVFHIGMQAVDEFGPGDPDGDGVENELTTGQMSALHIFLTTNERPFQQKLDRKARRGKRIFNRIGCSGCHVPTINTKSPILEYRVEEDEEPYYSVDLSRDVSEGSVFETNSRGGLKLPIFSDYKRHNMGTRLAETAHFLETPDCDNEVAGTEISNCNFITMKLWGLADTAPYLHDGRALSIFEAIAFHGGEAQRVRDRFLRLSKGGQNALLSYLGTLKNPENPNQDVLDQIQLGP